ncbi:GntR family transcriptional regulator [Phaeovulum sp. W22_SRMD_FR3]|uniref:GntR family transcriptional regulator n=1 Tax=Phaeovulum sp. W22_SRMD_FR3 TaxID=3240274 RepID=UPI003F96B7C3
MEARDTPEFADLLLPTNRSKSAPLWSQVKSALSQLILKGELSEHAQLPSEAELCLRFGVSRTVVREALSQLVNERMIYKLQGKGAFVAGRRDEQDFIGTTLSFSGELADKSKTVSHRNLRQEIALPNVRMCKLLGISSDTPVVVLDRLLSVDGHPRFIVRCALPEHFVPGLDKMPMENRSLYDTIGRQYGIRLVRAERWIEATSAGPEEVKLLQVPLGSPLLGIESVGSNDRGEKIEYYTSLYLTDRSRLHFSVVAPNF